MRTPRPTRVPRHPIRNPPDTGLGGVLAAGSIGLGLLLGTAAEAAAPIPRAAALATAQALPQRSTDSARLAGDSGQFAVTQPSANRLLVSQNSAKIVVNWDRFDIAAGNTVQFAQPANGSALNRIWDANPSVIQGRITANAEVILQNSNGLIFGPNARVDTGRFVATALQVSDEAFRRGLRAATDGSPSFSAPNGATSGFVSIERGAEIVAAAGGDVLIFAPRVVNEGRIETPGGQAVLGAGQTVYLAASADPALHGLLIGIRPFATDDAALNTVTQADAKAYKTADGQTVADSTPDTTAGLVSKVNAIVAERGTINLVGLAIRQQGLLQATTAVKGQNGVILLQAQADVNPLAEQLVGTQPVNVPRATALGTVTLGPTSVTSVMPSTDQATQLDPESFNPSRIRIEGQTIVARSGAQVLAPAGRIELLASNAPETSVAFDPTSFNLSDHATDPSRIVIEAGATISAAGLRDVVLPMSRNQASGRLFQVELADSPVQRDGVLYREEVFFDSRKSLSIANVSGFSATIGRTAQEHSMSGGAISIQSDGAIAIDAGARLDVSGGNVRYEAGQIRTSLLREGSNWVPIDKAQAGTRYDELGNSKSRTDAGEALFRVEQVPGYVQGSDAGTLALAGRRMYVAGALDGSVVVGPRQTGRGPDAMPTPGELDLGHARVTDTSLATIELSASAAGARPDALFSDPYGATVEQSLSPTLTLATNALAAAGIGRLHAYTSGLLTLDAGATLVLGASGEFVAAAGSARIDGSIRAPGGRIEISAEGDAGQIHDVSLGASARLDTSGQWITDTAARAADTAVIATSGGTVVLGAQGSLAAAAGASIDVSAGARRSGSSVATGKAGTLQLVLNKAADPTQPLPGRLDDWHATLSGYDFGKGGALTVSGLPSLTLGGSAAGDRLFDEAFFDRRGFGSITLSSLGDVAIGPAFRLDLSLSHYLPGTAPNTADGRWATVGIQPLASLRAPVSLAIQAVTAPNPVLGLDGSSLTMAAGSRISTEAGGNLTLSARRRLTLGGELDAPGGTIRLSLPGLRGGSLLAAGVYEDTTGFLPDQAIWLTSEARLSVAGVAETQRNRLGQDTGTVFGGGTIAIDAQRGYVVAEAGSALDLRGASATLLSAAAATPQTVSRAGGSLTITTAEGLRFDADVSANAADAAADGGSLAVALSLNARERFTSGAAYSAAPREVHIAPGPAAGSVGQPGGDVGTWLPNGQATIDNSMLRRAGFSRVSLKADDRIVVDANLTLQAPLSITLDAPALAVAPTAEAKVRAPYVALGDQRHTERLSFESAPAATAGDATLDVRGWLIEVFGDFALQGTRFAALGATLDGSGGQTRSDGEVRLVGTTRGLAPQPSGSLAFDGELQVIAGQLYTTTLSQFRISGTAPESAFGSYQPFGTSSSQLPLSALGSLQIDAGRIDVYGVIRQPFGSIALNAATLDLHDGSAISVGGDSLTVPVGTTVNGRAWRYRADGLYQTNGAAKSVDATSNPDILALDTLPVAKGIALSGAALTIEAGATLSAAGGGHLQAWEFVQGVGGSADALAKAGFYAVLPDRSYAFAPRDSEVTASSLGLGAAGGQVQIAMAGSALAPGRYTLLPARYALLPGAVLVSVAPDQGKSPLAVAQAQDDGGVVITGYLTTPGSNASAPLRLLVQPQTTVLAQSRLDRTDVGSLLGKLAQAEGSAAPGVPLDAGRVRIVSQAPFDLVTAPQLQAAEGGRAGMLDLASGGGAIAIVDAIRATPAGTDESWTRVAADALSGSGAASIVIGGTRSDDGASLQIQNRTVRVAATAQPLTTHELMLVAERDVVVDPNVRITAVGTADASARTITLAGDGALAIVSSATGTEIRRSGLPAAPLGTVTIGEQAQLSGPALALDAAAALALAPSIGIRAQSLALSAQHLVIGQPDTAAADATVLHGGLLDVIAATPAVRLGSSSSLDFAGKLSMAFSSLALDAPRLMPVVAGGDAGVELSANTLTLRNTTGLDGTAVANPSGSLRLSSTGASITVGETGGAVSADGSGAHDLVVGFARTDIRGAGDLTLAGEGRLLASGGLTLVATRVVAETGARQTLSADGLLQIESTGAVAAAAAVPGHGARLRFSGRQIQQFGTVEVPGGQIEFVASGVAGQTGIAFGPDSLTSVAGFDVQASPTWTLYGDAGRISARSDLGSITVAGRIDASALGSARGGELDFSTAGSAAAQVALLSGADLRGAGGASGGSLAIDAGQIVAGNSAGDLDALAAVIGGSGFERALTLRQRSGDLTLGSSTLRAREVSVAADQGSLTIDGQIDARAPAGGKVRLFAGGDLTLGGRIDAASTRPGANGGDVAIGARDGRVTLRASAQIDAAGDEPADGRIVLRAGRDDDAGSVRVTVDPGFDSAVQLAAAEIDIEAVRVYSGYDSIVAGDSRPATFGTQGTIVEASLGQQTIADDNQAFIDRASTVLADLRLGSDHRAMLRGGAEIIAAGNFTVADDWNLSTSDSGATPPGFLTIRAAGSLSVAGSISAGFADTERYPGAMIDGAATSIRLVAGADGAAADPLATRRGGSGDLNLAAGAFVRTTAGSIDLAAAHDVQLGSTTSPTAPAVVYVAGRPQANADTSDPSAWFTAHGGNLTVEAGNDVKGTPAVQLFGAWFEHVGATHEGGDPVPVSWWSNLGAFRLGLGSFGGGSIEVQAGRDVLNLGVVAPTSAQTLTTTPAALQVNNGGDVTVRAGRDIAGGAFLLGRGDGVLQAGNRIMEGDAISATRVGKIAPLLGLMEGTFTLRAGGDLAFASVLNPTMLPSVDGLANAGLYFTYAADSTLDAASTAGRVDWMADRPAGQPSMTQYFSGLARTGPADERIAWSPVYQSPTAWLPPIVRGAAFGGNLALTLPSASSGLTLYPSAQGQLELYASADLNLISNLNTVAMVMSDQAPASLPSVSAPLGVDSDALTATAFSTRTTAATIRWDGITRSATDPLRLAAGGDLDLSQGSRAAQQARVVLVSPKAAELSAGGSILDLSYVGQQTGVDAVTRITAGGNFIQDAQGGSNRITLGGPGELRIVAGRQIDLGSSQGVETVGNQYLASLPPQGASITLAAGQRATLDVETFTQRYFAPGASAGSAAGQAAALADAFFVAQGKNPAALGTDDIAVRATLVQRYAALLSLTGADDAALAQRRGDWVAIVRSATAMPALSSADAAAAYDATQSAFRSLAPTLQATLAERFLGQLFAQTYLAAGQPYAPLWQAATQSAGVSATRFEGPVFDRVKIQVLFAELAQAGGWASLMPRSAADTRNALYAIGFGSADLAGQGSSQRFAGDIDMVASGVQAAQGGDITLLAPGGQINVGLPGTGSTSSQSLHGVITYGRGNLSAFADGDFQVNSQRVFVVGQGDIDIWSSRGNIDAGRGANTAITIPPLQAVRQADGSIAFTLQSVSVGSGIGILQPAVGQAAGNIGLYAPNGEVLALDAQIRAPGRITLAAQVVRGADNIAGGSVVGAPVVVPPAAISVTPDSGASAAAQGAGTAAAQGAAAASAARERSSLLLVELLGLGASTDDSDEGLTEEERKRRRR